MDNTDNKKKDLPETKPVKREISPAFWIIMGIVLNGALSSFSSCLALTAEWIFLYDNDLDAATYLDYYVVTEISAVLFFTILFVVFIRIFRRMSDPPVILMIVFLLCSLLFSVLYQYLSAAQALHVQHRFSAEELARIFESKNLFFFLHHTLYFIVFAAAAIYVLVKENKKSRP